MVNKGLEGLPPIPDHSVEFGELWGGPLQAFTPVSTTVYISSAAQARIDAYWSRDDLTPPSDDETSRPSPLIKNTDGYEAN
jgi:hypothetical protein